MKKTLRLILGDQLNHNHSWYQQVDDEVVYVMMEIRTETDYVKHHIQKVVAFFQAMRLFANELNKNGFKYWFERLQDKYNILTGNLFSTKDSRTSTTFVSFSCLSFTIKIKSESLG